MKTLEQKIMARVWRVYYLKKAINPFMFKLYGVTVLMVGVTSFVSVKNVIANMPSLTNVGSMYNFTTSALLNTEATVQVALAILAVFVILLIRDAAKNFAHGAQLAEVRA